MPTRHCATISAWPENRFFQHHAQVAAADKRPEGEHFELRYAMHMTTGQDAARPHPVPERQRERLFWRPRGLLDHGRDRFRREIKTTWLALSSVTFG